MLLAAAIASPLSAQQTTQPTAATSTASASESATATLNVDVRLVNIPVVVRDKKGALVQTLTKDNFALSVDGHTQTIHYFDLDRDLPLTLGLLVDVSQSQRDAIDEERTASFAFLDDMLTGSAERDKAFVVQFARQTDLLQDTTSSKPKLQAGLKQLETPASGGDAGANSPAASSDSDAGGNGRPRHGGTTLYDALFLSSDELMHKLHGRKAVIILSDGVDNGSKESLASSIEAAQRADTIVYAIYFKGKEGGGYQDRNRQGGGFPGGGGSRGGGISFPGSGGGYPGGGSGGRGGGQGKQPENRAVDGKKILQRMADETGGRLFEVSKKQTVADIYKQIGEELRGQYRLGYTPDKDTASDGYHRIGLTMTKSNLKDFFIQTRDGYYAGN
ncbi:MAG: VWA domain-containing protein [Acidobacteriaceae bacterium]|nr:VWA domain-containing protein [Acidobacteriaceae bacterium]